MPCTQHPIWSLDLPVMIPKNNVRSKLKAHRCGTQIKIILIIIIITITSNLIAFSISHSHFISFALAMQTKSFKSRK